MKTKMLLWLPKLLVGALAVAIPVRAVMLQQHHDGGMHLPYIDALLRWIIAWICWAASIFRHLAKVL